MYGEQTGANCASIDTAVAFQDDVRGANVAGMNIRYAGTGIAFSGECCSDNRTFSNSTLESCQTGIYSSACNVTVQNSAISGVQTPSATANSGTVSGTWVSTCPQVSLHQSVVAGMQALMSSHSPSTGILLYNLAPTNYFAQSYNTNCWIYGLKGMTSICVSNNNGVWNQLGSVLITPKHAVTADHVGLGIGSELRFIGKSGANYRAWVTNATTIQPPTAGDIKILTLDRDLTNDVETTRVLPIETYLKMTLEITNIGPRNGCLSRYLPGVAIDQSKGAYAADAYAWNTDPNAGGYAVYETGSSWFTNWIDGYAPRGGDSGHPVFTVISNELVLVGCWTSAAYVPSFYLTPILGTTVKNAFTNLYGLSFNSSNTIVALSAARWNVNSNLCCQPHQLTFFNSMGSNLASVTVTAEQNDYQWSESPLLAWLTLPGGLTTNYYLLSQEIAGGDYWYDWHGTTLRNPAADYTVQGAAYAWNSIFTTYGSTGNSYGPVSFSYFVYPGSGTISMPGGYTNAINACLSSNGGPQYKINVFGLASFPNSIR